MRRTWMLTTLLAPLALSGCGAADTRYKAALDQVALRDRQARDERARAEALARRVARLEQRLAEAERARRAAAAEAAASRALAAAQVEARARLESELDAAIAEAHRAEARLAEVAGPPAEPWRGRACSPLGALLREAGLCASEARPVLVIRDGAASGP